MEKNVERRLQWERLQRDKEAALASSPFKATTLLSTKAD